MKRIVIVLIIILLTVGCADSYNRGYELGKADGRLEGLNVCEGRLVILEDKLNKLIIEYKGLSHE